MFRPPLDDVRFRSPLRLRHLWQARPGVSNMPADDRAVSQMTQPLTELANGPKNLQELPANRGRTRPQDFGLTRI
ncbi:hypothetical protein PoB_004359800 [Plakobranchus ocellatus]|uniref:Uncharacterized protein n=1 Tax=Plakobranchus ocellatus TaxID=259542 RepID=A0AAV4BC03_9GAST|nr:hypothetical protein PoB_004359800 [Plakobranchus ocellatus]